MSRIKVPKGQQLVAAMNASHQTDQLTSKHKAGRIERAKAKRKKKRK